MIIKRLKIKNFRCFGPEETTVELENLTTIIGTNSSGKTAILNALLKLFGRNGKERELKRSDFHVPKGKNPEEIEKNKLSIEAVIYFPELVNNRAIAERTVPDLFQRMIVDGVNGDPYARIRLDASWQKSNYPEGEIDSNLSFITVPEDEELDNSGKNRSLVTVNEIRSNIQIIYVPAIREPSFQLRNASGTILWRILNGINWPEDINVQINDKTKPINSIFDSQEGVKKVQEIISAQWKSFHRDHRYSEARVKFTSSDLNTILDNLYIEFSPTETPKSYNIDSLGEGLRSLFYFSLVNSLLELEYLSQSNLENQDEKKIFNFLPPSLTILAVEEPENHIAPQLLGRIIRNLNQIAEKKNAQVVLTSHSPSIVKRIDPESIRHVRINKENLCTKVSKIHLPQEKDEVYKYVKEAVTSYPEIYFARLVVLGEGDSENIIISKLIDILDPQIDSCGINIVPLGGRFVNHFWKLLKDLEIPFITLLDLDSERHGGGWGRIKYAIKQLLEIGYNLEDICQSEKIEKLSETDLELMHNLVLKTIEDRKKITRWVKHLENYGIYYSYPLDLDFSMLKAFKESYQTTAPIDGGPRIPNKEDVPDKYNKNLKRCINQTLKGEDGKGNTYYESEKELMLWYPYLFLNRGKPETHILAIANLDDDLFNADIPDSLKRLIQGIKIRLIDDPYSSSVGLQ